MEQVAQQRAGWFRRNWLWLVPTAGCGGCLTIVALVVVVAVGVGATAMRHSDVYKEALARAQGSAELSAEIGAPMSPGLFTTGNIEITNGRGHADLTIPISGPRGKAKLHAVAAKDDGAWQFSRLEAVLAGSGRRIDLIGAANQQLEKNKSEAAPGPTEEETKSSGESDW